MATQIGRRRFAQQGAGTRIFRCRSVDCWGCELRYIRSRIAKRLGLRSEAAMNGDWWEIDLIIVILFGAFVMGIGILLTA